MGTQYLTLITTRLQGFQTNTVKKIKRNEKHLGVDKTKIFILKETLTSLSLSSRNVNSLSLVFLYEDIF